MAKYVSCKHCHKKGLQWERTDQGFRLFSSKGKHICSSHTLKPRMGDVRPPALKLSSNRQRLDGVLLSNYRLENGLLNELGVK